MADTRTQLQVENWIVNTYLPNEFHHAFAKMTLALEWGGEFEFDAVSEDRRLAICISTSHARTASGKNAIGKFHKIMADTLFLQAAVGVSRRILMFTDNGMVDHFKQQKARGRFPPSIELLSVGLPETLRSALQTAEAKASQEVSP